MRYLPLVLAVASSFSQAAIREVQGEYARANPAQVICQTAKRPVTADSSGSIGASDAIQKCLDTALLAGTSWKIPAGFYSLDKAITITRPIHLDAYNVTFKAVDGVTGTGKGHTLIFAGYMSDVRIQGLTIDGNLEERGQSEFCNGTNDAYMGGNIHFDHVDDAVIRSVTTRNAPCGSGMHFSGKRASITHSWFQDNGTPEQELGWADGLTLLNCDDCTITDNVFLNNTDVSFVFGGGTNTVVTRNQVYQDVPAFAAFALDNFNGSQSGNFIDTVVVNNWIDCTAMNCNFGMNIGPHAWYLSENIEGGRVNDNVVKGAKIGVMAGGAGTARSPTSIFRNSVAGSPAYGTLVEFSCGLRSGAPAMYSVDSVILSHGEAIVRDFHRECP